MDRRRFLQLFGGGVVASATIAEAGFLAEFMAWMKRKPVWSFPSNPAAFNSLATIYYDRTALDAFNHLRANMLFTAIEKMRPLPPRTGKIIQLYSYVPLNPAGLD